MQFSRHDSIIWRPRSISGYKTHYRWVSSGLDLHTNMALQPGYSHSYEEKATKVIVVFNMIGDVSPRDAYQNKRCVLNIDQLLEARIGY